MERLRESKEREHDMEEFIDVEMGLGWPSRSLYWEDAPKVASTPLVKKNGLTDGLPDPSSGKNPLSQGKDFSSLRNASLLQLQNQQEPISQVSLALVQPTEPQYLSNVPVQPSYLHNVPNPQVPPSQLSTVPIQHAPYSYVSHVPSQPVPSTQLSTLPDQSAQSSHSPNDPNPPAQSHQYSNVPVPPVPSPHPSRVSNIQVPEFHVNPHSQVQPSHLTTNPQIQQPHLTPNSQVQQPHLTPNPQVQPQHLTSNPQVQPPHLTPNLQAQQSHVSTVHIPQYPQSHQSHVPVQQTEIPQLPTLPSPQVPYHPSPNLPVLQGPPSQSFTLPVSQGLSSLQVPKYYSKPAMHPSNPSLTGTLKPKDIEMLRLEDLGQLHAKALMTVFFKAVRSLGKSEYEAIQVAMNRMDLRLRLFVGSRLNTQVNPTLDWLENLLQDEFPGPLNLADAIRDLYSLDYDISENPRVFSNMFKTKYETLMNSFPTKGCPSRATMLKQVMTKGLPYEVKQRLELFLTEGYSEELFISELERERANFSLQVSAISSGNICNQTHRSQNRSNNSRTCPYCQDGSRHYWKHCPRKPQWNSCFDCLDTTHRKGDPRCPGKESNPNPSS